MREQRELTLVRHWEGAQYRPTAQCPVPGSRSPGGTSSQGRLCTVSWARLKAAAGLRQGEAAPVRLS